MNHKFKDYKNTIIDIDTKKIKNIDTLNNRITIEMMDGTVKIFNPIRKDQYYFEVENYRSILEFFNEIKTVVGY